jgi:hypothetical protein
MKKDSVCAWCFPEKEEKGISHGICKECLAKMESPDWRWNPQRKEFEPSIVRGLRPLTY